MTEIILYPSTKYGSYNIPSTVISIDVYAFWNCLNLTSITIPTSVTSIKWAAFAGCSSLTSVTIPSSVLSLERYAFQYCTNLTSVIIPSSVSSIGNSIFQGCSNLASIYSYSAVPVDLSSAPEIFIGVNFTSCKLYVPFGAKSAYQSAIQWQNFTNIVEMSGPVSDVDGNSYSTVAIGTQVWMAENLKTTKLNDSQLVPLTTSTTDWKTLTTPGYCWYNNDATSYKDVYGAIYNWYSVSTGKLCPTGWHVPSDAEWTILINYLGGSGIAGGKLKETGTVHWDIPNQGATNETRFTALPGGARDLNLGFRSIRLDGHWWSATESTYDTTNAWMVYIPYDESSIILSFCCINQKNYGYSVRCLKD
jgi:uncharacterized protein (TIGR02145 family)